MDAVDSSCRVTAPGIHDRPRHTTYLAAVQRVFHTGTGNPVGTGRFLRFIHRGVGRIPARLVRLIGGERRCGSGAYE